MAQTEVVKTTARQLLQIIPFLMQGMAAQMREVSPPVAPAHLRLLMILSTRSRTLTELANIIEVSAPTMSNTVSTLEERGWVQRTRSTKDRRVVLIQTTNEGRRVLEDVYCQAENYLAELLESLNPADQEKLSEGLAMLRQAFENTMPQKLGRHFYDDPDNIV